MKAQADHYPNNLVIPGVEVTTYRGHWNNQGSSALRRLPRRPDLQPSRAGRPDRRLGADPGRRPAHCRRTSSRTRRPAAAGPRSTTPPTSGTTPSALPRLRLELLRRRHRLLEGRRDRDLATRSARSAGEPPVHDRRDRLLRARARQRRPHRGVGSSDAHKAGTDPISPVGAGCDRRLLGGRPEQAGHHRRGQGRTTPT